MTFGTSHFVSLRHARTYYKRQGLGHDVKRKITDGEITIGKPKPRKGCTICINDEGRYVYSEDTA